ncbi:uncharacterized protein LOC114535020 [Dendronephthya gigantea]|uniref:uncharacterized protein LOC114535020 n=1 Tax=Dendronephthya gigantea TaxID=151771 RepID=UPI00106C55B5|nr:uncharacterized protein LOC114535020 [Dendronephthya gigantea]
MRTIEKSVRIAHSQGKNWKTELYRFLLDYRTTPHVTTGIAPTDLLFNRQVRNRLPDSNAVIPEGKRRNPEKISSAKTSREAVLQREKRKIKDRADIRNRAKELQFRVGDLVLLKQSQRNKLYLPWDPLPYRVTKIKGSQITAKRRGVMVTRNSSHFKRVIPYMQEVDDPYSNSSEEEEDGEGAVQQQQDDSGNEIESDLSDEDTDNAEQDQPLSRYPRRGNRGIPPQYYEEEIG